MLVSIAFLFFCLQFIAESNQGLDFPLDHQQFQLLSWVDCKTEELVQLIDVDGYQQLRLQKGKGVCLDQKNQLPLDQDHTYNYTFIFNRALKEEDQLYIFIDYKMYNLSRKITAQPFVQIQHFHFQTCMNSIEFWLNSSAQLNIIFFYIAKFESNSKDQVFFVGQLPPADDRYKFNFDFSQTFLQDIKNNIIYYSALIKKSENENSLFYWFKLYLFESFLPQSIQQLDSKYFIIKGSQNITSNNHRLLNNLPFLIKTQYKIEQVFLFLETYETIEFEVISQIDEDFSSLSQTDIYIKKQFKPTNIIKMQVDVKQTLNNSFGKITILPKNYNTCIQDLVYSNAKISVRNEQQENIIECYFNDDDKADTCLQYNRNDCTFQINWQFQNDTQYSYELRGTLKKQIQTDPYIFFQTDTQYFEIMKLEEDRGTETWIIWLLIIQILLGFLFYFLSVFCIFSLKIHHPYIQYLIELDKPIYINDLLITQQQTLQQQ